MNEAIRQVTHVQNIRYDKATERLYIIDQTLLPNEEKEIELRTVEEMIEAIKMLRIRGGPAHGGEPPLGGGGDAGCRQGPLEG